MTLQDIIGGLDGSEVACRDYGKGGYKVFVSEDVEPGTYLASFCAGEMPPHDTMRFRSIDAAVAHFTSEDMSDRWRVEAVEV